MLKTGAVIGTKRKVFDSQKQLLGPLSIRGLGKRHWCNQSRGTRCRETRAVEGYNLKEKTSYSGGLKELFCGCIRGLDKRAGARSKLNVTDKKRNYHRRRKPHTKHEKEENSKKGKQSNEEPLQQGRGSKKTTILKTTDHRGNKKR